MSEATPIQVLSLAQLAQWAPGSLARLHVRHDHLFLWITRGQGRIVLHGLRRGFGAHNAIFVPAGRLLAIEAGRQMIGHAVLIPDDNQVTLPDRCHHLRAQDVMVQSELTGLIEEMRRELDANRPFLSEAMIARAQLLAIWLKRQMRGAEDPARADAGERLVRRFADLVATDFQTGQSLADYADRLDITPTHLSRACRKANGMTASDMLSQCLEYEARRRLVATEQPVQDIAQDLGFGSAAYFSRFMQQRCGLPPSQLRKSSSPHSGVRVGNETRPLPSW
ncbi:AraC-type DNA-binding protein [Salinihabitans flavidus]|uniref:AraC-type DNA-binding protein n=1 Tax=Salinihabitans flavidus TaxID=569882 RepID=A0A1H8NEZ6_9RHOB|nr:AraC family transcriptional regulator [Salinihabitans flavidus]SEO28311.1 AraC-type DNA-binding protein [Salinihabitans flavidus]